VNISQPKLRSEKFYNNNNNNNNEEERIRKRKRNRELAQRSSGVEHPSH